MPTDESKRGVGAWVRRWWRAFVSETVATALLVVLGIASLLKVGGQEPPLAHPALAFGFIIVANVEAFGAASGAHMNPAVTLASVLDRRLPPLAALAYVVAQLLGATLGFAALMIIAPAAFKVEGVVAGGTSAGAVGAPAAAALEALLTGVLVLLCCSLWAAHEAGTPDPAASVKLGLTVAGLIYAGGMMTGASLNPARSFAPALLQHFQSDHWVYWVGPLSGAVLATMLHRYVLRPPRAAPVDLPEALPLHDKQEH